ncbi:MAG: glycosyltransferase family 2 protein [Candidatus Calescibacterium sp.]
MKPKVYIITINYKNWYDTIECLESVLRNDYPNYQVIVIDNNSPNNSMEYLKAWAEGKIDIWVDPRNPLRRLSFPPVPKPIPYVFYTREEAEKGGNLDLEKKLEGKVPEGVTTKYPIVFIQSGDNLGFAGGNNLGIKYALAKNDFDYIWFLNNDTVIESGALEKMVDFIDKNTSVGAVGSLSLFYSNPDIVQACCGTTTFRFISDLSPLFQNKRKMEIFLQSFELKNSFLQGVSMLIRRRTIEEIGLFDENLFMMFEESELCLRMIKRGWKVWCIPQSIIYHKVGGSRQSQKYVTRKFLWKVSRRLNLKDSYFTLYLYHRNFLYSVKKHYGLIPTIFFLLGRFPTYYLRIIIGILLFDDKKLERIKLLGKALIDGIVGNMGKTLLIENENNVKK